MNKCLFNIFITTCLCLVMQLGYANTLTGGPIYGQTIRFTFVSNTNWQSEIFVDFNCDTCFSSDVRDQSSGDHRSFDAKLTYALPSKIEHGKLRMAIKFGWLCSFDIVDSIPFSIDASGNMVIAPGNYNFGPDHNNDNDCKEKNPILISDGTSGDVINLIIK